jgi:hypothetical protein
MSFPILRRGEFVNLTSEGKTVNAMVVLASPNGRSLMLMYDGALSVGDGFCMGSMPVLVDDDGVFRCLAGNAVVEIRRRQAA